MWIFVCGSFKSPIMSLFTLAWPCCLMGMRPDVFLDKKYGLRHCVYSPPADVWVLLSHRCVEHSGGKPQDSLSPLPLHTWVSFTQTYKSSVTSHSLHPAHHTHTHNRPQRDKKREQTESSLMAACFEKMESTWRADPFKVKPGAWSWITRGMVFSLCLLREWHTPGM